MLNRSDIHTATHLFRPARLTLARELRMLTKSDLAAQIDKTPSAVSQFESGKVRPDSSTVLRLALALNVPPGFFAFESRADFIPIETCHFRSLRSASQRNRRKLLAIGTHLSDLVGLLEQYAALPPENVPAAADSTQPLSDDDVERCAADVRRRWGLGLGPIPNVVRLLETRGIVVCPIEAGSKDVDAFSFWHVHRPYVFLVMDKRSPSRSRFDACHELGHLAIHSRVRPGEPMAERQADRFASAFLLPRESFLRECPDRLNWDHFYELKRRWRVSVAALLHRARDLGMISTATYRRAFIHLNRTGQRTHEEFEPPEETPELIAKAVEIASEEIPMDHIATDSGMPPSTFEALLGLIRLAQDSFPSGGQL